LAAGRVAGRYVLCVAGGEAGMGLISVIAMTEMYYNAGFGVGFWGGITLPIGLIFALTGFQLYRFRETKAMTMGQFLEIRYSRKFRIFAAVLQSISGILNYAIFPAVGARFLIYFLNLPITVSAFGIHFPVFGLLMAAFLSLALFITMLGGQITIMTTDCVMGILSYPMYLILVVYIIWRIPWFSEMYPTLIERPAGESFINAFQIQNLKDFNLFYVMVGIIGSVLNRLSWSGAQGYNASAKNAHEQKMGGLLGYWRAGFSGMMILFIALAAYVYMHNTSYVKHANIINRELAIKAASDIMHDAPEKTQKALLDKIRTAQPRILKEVPPEKYVDRKATNKTVDNYIEVGYNEIRKYDKSKAQTFKTIHHQMIVPVTVREMLPVGITGIFCAIMIFLMVSTDTTYMHSWGSILIQDIVLPLRGKPFKPKTQLKMLRISIGCVAVFAFIFSFFFAQLDYILMFFAITGAIWLGGSGTCITFGLYWKKGTTAGAFSALISGAVISVGGILLQNNWAKHLYPWLETHGFLDGFQHLLSLGSIPFCGMVHWKITPGKFPINSQEIYFMTIVIAILLYVVVSLLTCRKPFNLEKMLYRGIYGKSGKEIPKTVFSFKKLFIAMTGVNDEYTRGDKILAWSCFIYSFIYTFLICFVGTIVWNLISPWPDSWWGMRFFVLSIVTPGIIGVVSTFWFTIGGIVDLRKLFKALAEKQEDDSDDGMVRGDSPDEKAKIN